MLESFWAQVHWGGSAFWCAAVTLGEFLLVVKTEIIKAHTVKDRVKSVSYS